MPDNRTPTKSADGAYRVDLAYVHDAGFGHFATAAADVLVERLAAARVRQGLVVELGCGSGIQSERVAGAGYDVLGYDISPDMIALSRRRVPGATFRVASVFDAEIPPCRAVTAVGEVLNYRFDRRHSPARLARLFRRVYEALQPGGLFLFDVALLGRVPGGNVRNATLADDWACLYEATEDAHRKSLVRRITTFRRVGSSYRRSDEVHRLRLFEPGELTAPLEKLGFRVRTLRRYGPLRFPPGYLGIAAHKPRASRA